MTAVGQMGQDDRMSRTKGAGRSHKIRTSYFHRSSVHRVLKICLASLAARWKFEASFYVKSLSAFPVSVARR